MRVESLRADPVPRRLVAADLVNASSNRAFGAARVFGHDGLSTFHSALDEIRFHSFMRLVASMRRLWPLASIVRLMELSPTL